jgi:hypothetical protein
MTELIKPFPWRIEDPSIIHFLGAKNEDGTQGEDLNYDVTVQAGYKNGTTKISCMTDTMNGALAGETSVYVTVVNNQIALSRQRIEAPSVGTGISTSQMYLMSNMGTDMCTNSLTEPRMLRNARVAAILNNSFSAGYPIIAGGEAPVKVMTGDLSDLSFQLCDGNFRPIKLMNPMYLTIIANPVDQNPNEDITSFNGKLPKDKPTVRELAEQQKQQQEQEIQQKLQQKQALAKQEALLKKLTVEQQLQFLLLPPEQQQYFLSYVDRMAEKAREQERERQMLIQEVTQQVYAQIPPEQKMLLQLLPPPVQERILQPQLQQQFQQIELQKQLQEQQEQQQEDQAYDAAVDQQQQQEQLEDQQIEQYQEQEQIQAQAEQQEQEEVIQEFELAGNVGGTF